MSFIEDDRDLRVRRADLMLRMELQRQELSEYVSEVKGLFVPWKDTARSLGRKTGVALGGSALIAGLCGAWMFWRRSRRPASTPSSSGSWMGDFLKSQLQPVLFTLAGTALKRVMDRYLSRS